MSAKYLMQAVGADGVVGTWLSGIADWTAIGFTGTAPAADVVILKPPAAAGGGGGSIPSPTAPGQFFQSDGSLTPYWGAAAVAESISSFTTTSSALFRAGAASPNPVVGSLAYNHAPVSCTVQDDQGNAAVSLTTPFTSWSYPHPYTKNVVANVILTAHAIDSLGSVSTKPVTLGWGFDVYHGQAATCTTAANTQALPHSVLAQARQIANFAAESTGGNYDWFAIPTTFGAPTFTDVTTGSVIPFSKTTSALNVTNANGVTVTYDIWRSDNPGIGTLGTAVIKVT